MTLAVILVAVGAGAAVDLRTRRIPNAITVSTAAAGVLLAATSVTPISLSSSLLGLMAGLALMLPGHLMGATGAGDVKLFAATGAVIGVGDIWWAFCYTAIAGGVLAVGWALGERQLGTAVGRLGAMVRPARSVGREDGGRARRMFPLRVGDLCRPPSGGADLNGYAGGQDYETVAR